MQPIRQGDVILLPTKQIAGKKLSHLTLAEGEVTGNSHSISNGQAELYEQDGILYLRVLSKTATLNHQEHHALEIPQGNWMVRIQREYLPPKRKSVVLQKEKNRELRDNLIYQAQKAQTQSSGRSSRSKPKSATPPQKSSKTESWDDVMSQIQEISEQDLMAQVKERSEQLPQQTARSRQEQVAPTNKISPVQKILDRFSGEPETSKPRKAEPRNWRYVVD